MSNLLPNPYNNMPGPPQVNANPGPQVLNHNQQYSQVPLSQLPPGYGGLKQDANSNSPLHVPVSAPQNNFISQVQNVNNYNQSGSNSPAFNHPGMLPPTSQTSLQSSPMRPLIKPTTVAPSPTQNPLPPQTVPLTSASPRTVTNVNASPTPYPPNFPLQQQQINDNAPPLIPSSQYLNQPLSNGPPMSGPPGSVLSQPSNQFAVSSSAFSVPPLSSGSTTSATSYGPGSTNPPFGQFQGTPPPGSISRQPGSTIMTSQTNMMFPGPPLSGPPRNSPLMTGPPFSSGPPLPPQVTSGPPLGPPRPLGVNGPTSKTVAGLPTTGPTVSGPPVGPPTGFMGSGPSPGPYGGTMGPPISGPSMRPPLSGPPTLGHGNSGFAQNPVPTAGLMGPLNMPTGPQSLTGPQAGPPIGLHTLPPMGQPMGQPPTSVPPGPGGIHGPPRPPAPLGPSVPPGGSLTGPTATNMQSRYPQIPQSNYVNQQTAQLPPQSTMSRQYPSQYNTQGLSQQMGQLSVTRQGFDQLWGHNTLDLLQCRHILPEYPEDPPEIRLGHQFAESPNCSPDIFRCTINRIPESNSLLQKSRLPLGILIHPFKDLNHLPVIQCAMIVRCRACRTYINPFVYFVDAKRWKCNLCYRVNDLPEEFQYDPVSKTYGDPSRRPEIKSATIEFIAPAEYMLRPPQPAIYLFLMDVSQIARDSGYLQVMCETLKNSLDQLPGDARTQVGFICYDAHIHYYLMSDGLTRPKEMTVLDIDDVFLPSPESLLVNLGERRELVKELLTVLPQRHSGPGVPNSALGAALQAAYKLLAPTGGRISVFQTCLPNIGPGALQPREDPNARSSKDVAHLNPATDFYKRLALDCSGAQVAVDLFLLSSQYCDLATLSGMSKFSGGSVYHIPLFMASRVWQADQFRRALTRYLTRKIGFEAVMRVRCTRGLSIHTFHGNFFVRSTDLLSLPNVSPDAGFGMQLTIEESLADLQQVCFQAALLYTSSKGERRIRVHTLALPIANNLTDVLHSADQQCIIGLLSKMAVDRCASASLAEAREALMNVAVDALCAHRLAQALPAGALSAALHAPAALRLLPLYLLALLKRKAFRTGTSTRLDDRVADMCGMKCMPLAQVLRAVYPDLYAVHALRDHAPQPDDDDDNDNDNDNEPVPDPPRMHLSAERINSNGAYLLDDGETMIVYVCHGVSAAYLSDTFGVAAFSQLPDEARALPRLHTDGNALLHTFLDKLNDDRPYAANLLIIRDNSPSRTLFTERLVDDRVESAFSYYEFLQHVKSQVK